MIARRTPDSYTSSMFAMMTRALKDFVLFTDYNRAKKAASAQIVRRQARGSVMAQNGWYMSRKQLDRASKRADGAMRKLTKAFG